MQALAQLLDGVEAADPQQVLFQGPDESFGTAVALGLTDEGRRALDAEEAELALIVMGDELAAMVVADLQATGDTLGESAEAGAHALTKGLERLEPARLALPATTSVVVAERRARRAAWMPRHSVEAWSTVMKIAAWPSPVRVAVRSVPHISSTRSVRIVPSWAFGQLVRSGYLKGIIGLPANLFYGTGIPACIVVLDKENAAGRKGVFMVDASKGFIKDGNKNRLREQNIHRVVDTFSKQADVPRCARMVPLAEIAGPKNDFNLNLPRYIDSTEPEDLQDIDGHLRGGIPERDLDAFADYWQVLPGVRAALFDSAGRPGYARLKLRLPEVKPAIFGHAEFTAFNQTATRRFADWRAATSPQLTGFAKDGHPKALIESIAEDLLVTFRQAPLLDAYDIYQHLMDYWAETMQDDAYLIAAGCWVKGTQPREIVQVKNKDNKLAWPESHDYLKGKRRFKSDLVPAPILVARYFVAERDAIDALDDQLATLEQQLDEMCEENDGEEGLLAEVIEGEGDKQKITAKAVKARLK